MMACCISKTDCFHLVGLLVFRRLALGCITIIYFLEMCAIEV